MYFFLCNLSILDICLTTLIVPKLLLTFLGLGSISFMQCLIQMHFYITLQCLDYFLLSVMSFDRYVAICNPLHYNVILNKKICVLLAGVSWFLSIIDPIPVTYVISRFPFCTYREMDHFFCDLMPLLKISCGDISKVMTIIFSEGVILGFVSFILILSSYGSIFVVIIRMKTAVAKHRAFSTCSAHLTVIMMLYLSLVCVYIIPISDDHSNQKKAVGLLNTVLIPIVNPVLYSFRNKDVKCGIQKLLKGKVKILQNQP
ncbi:olfactory receptor 1C1-like [Engystomops pustulosus]